MNQWNSQSAADARTSMSASWAARMDTLLLGVLGFCFLYALMLAPQHQTWGLALVVGGGLLVLSGVLYASLRGSLLLQFWNAAAIQFFTALHIQQAHGITELHFGVFVGIAVVLAYRRWEPVLVGAGTIAAHHVVFNVLQSMDTGIYVFAMGASWLMVFEHAAYVVVETGVLAYLALQMQRDIQITEALTQATVQMRGANGQVCLDVPVADTKLQLLRDFSGALTSLDNSVVQVKSELASILQTLPSLQNESKKISGDAGDQLNQSAHIESSTAEMVSSINRMVDSIAEVTEAAKHAFDANHNGQAAYQEASNATGSLASTLQGSAQEVEQLSESCNEIVKAVSIIDEIAEQTNLLALNAAIEAARAGERGRGFAVVADEVRSLAQRSQETTESVARVVKELVGYADRSRSAMGDALEQVRQTVTLHEQADGAMHQINDSIGRIQSRVQHISESIHSQMDFSQQVAASACKMKSVNEVMASSASSNASILNQLTAKVQSLNESLQQIQTSRMN